MISQLHRHHRRLHRTNNNGNTNRAMGMRHYVLCVRVFELIRPPVPIAYASLANARRTDVIAASRRNASVRKTVRISPHSCAGFRSVHALYLCWNCAFPSVCCAMHAWSAKFPRFCIWKVNNNTFPIMLNFRLNSRFGRFHRDDETKDEQKVEAKQIRCSKGFSSKVPFRIAWSTSNGRANLPFCNVPIWWIVHIERKLKATSKFIYGKRHLFATAAVSIPMHCVCVCVTKSSSVFDRKVEIAFSAGFSSCEWACVCVCLRQTTHFFSCFFFYYISFI